MVKRAAQCLGHSTNMTLIPVHSGVLKRGTSSPSSWPRELFMHPRSSFHTSALFFNSFLITPLDSLSLQLLSFSVSSHSDMGFRLWRNLEVFFLTTHLPTNHFERGFQARTRSHNKRDSNSRSELKSFTSSRFAVDGSLMCLVSHLITCHHEITFNAQACQAHHSRKGACGAQCFSKLHFKELP